jgi:riboflavin transporter FmnP
MAFSMVPVLVGMVGIQLGYFLADTLVRVSLVRELILYLLSTGFHRYVGVL